MITLGPDKQPPRKFLGWLTCAMCGNRIQVADGEVADGAPAVEACPHCGGSLEPEEASALSDDPTDR